MKTYLYLILLLLVCVPAIAGTINSYELKTPPDADDAFVVSDSDDGSTKRVKIGDISGTGGSGGSVAAGWTDTGTDVLLTTTSDNVAIGTSTPVGKLTVVGNVSVAGSVESTGTESYAEFSELSADPDIPASGKGRLFQREDNHVYYIDDAGTVTDLVSAGAAAEWTSSSGKIYPTTLTDNVGIGTSVATGSTLTIKSPDTTGSGQSLVQYANGSTTSMTLLDEPSAGKPRLRMRNVASPTNILIQFDTNGNSFFNTGNVGMGTIVPLSQLHVKNATFPAAFIERTTVSSNTMSGVLKLKATSSAIGTDGLGTGLSFFLQDSSNTDSEIGGIGFIRSGADDTGDFSIRPATAGTLNERVVVKSGGNVGIGTATPREVVDVIGTVRASGFKSSDGTAGVTGSTCTAWKNGLCTSL